VGKECVIVLHFILLALLSFAFSEIMRKKGMIKESDATLSLK
jgi:uncharacterized membrane protein